MTTKVKVDLATYKKAPRLLGSQMEEALAAGGGLAPLLEAAKRTPGLRFEIRERRFNIYYRGGNLLCVDGRDSPWTMRFDKHYCLQQAAESPDLPPMYSSIADAEAWVEAFPGLMRTMDQWWQLNRRDERDHCQNIARDNSPRAREPSSDHLVLDLECQWAQRRFDMVAARCRPTETDPSGWREPDLVLVEVKSDFAACTRDSGLVAHAQDYADLLAPWGGVPDGRVAGLIKREYEGVIAQKRRLGLIGTCWPFRRFSDDPLELVIVLVGLDPESPYLRGPLREVSQVANDLGARGAIRLMCLTSLDYMMTSGKMLPLQSPPGAGCCA